MILRYRRLISMFAPTPHDVLDRYLELASQAAPFVDRAFAERVLERIRRLEGHWRATPFHGTLELAWPPGPR